VLGDLLVWQYLLQHVVAHRCDEVRGVIRCAADLCRESYEVVTQVVSCRFASVPYAHEVLAPSPLFFCFGTLHRVQPHVFSEVELC
jgi:hypothetical protein